MHRPHKCELLSIPAKGSEQSGHLAAGRGLNPSRQDAQKTAL